LKQAVSPEDRKMQDPSDTSGRLIAADEVQGTAVYNRAGEKLGTVEDIMIDKSSGKACYGILSFGGFLGMGGDRYPLPWEKLSYDTNQGGFVVDVTKDSLEKAPTYAQDDRWEDSDWRAVDTHYNTSSSF
jgi:sporulation protein YlmC with PRC-barrel domain